MMSDAQWFYLRGGEQFGPVSIAVLRDMATSGSLGPTDLVWREGSPAWSAVREVPELAGARLAMMRDPDRYPVRPHGSVGEHRPGHANKLWVAIGAGGLILGLLALATFSSSIVPRKLKDPTADAHKVLKELLQSVEEAQKDVDRKTGIRLPGVR